MEARREVRMQKMGGKEYKQTDRIKERQRKQEKQGNKARKSEGEKEPCESRSK